MSEKRFAFTVTSEFEGRRADEVLRAVFGMSARQIRLIKYQKGFYLDGKPVYANAAVKAGQLLVAECENGYDQGIIPEEGEFPVVYEDEHLMVIDKPAPLAITPMPGQPTGTLANRAAFYAGEERFIFRPVNRLDKGTSGLMVAAKHVLAQKKLTEILHTEHFVREYEALAEGIMEEDVLIDAPIERVDGDAIRRCVREDGKRSVTQVHVLKTCVQSNCTHVRLRLYTGRTHQIRVHLQHIGHPVVGDYIYGHAVDAWGERFALHAAHLVFTHPFTGERMEFHSEMPRSVFSYFGGV